MLSPEIEGYYLRTRESARLAGVEGELERVRTQSILARHLPPAPAVLYDIGGAAGVYAFPLAELGYQVHLIDPVERHLEDARAVEAESEVRLASIRGGDARQLDIADANADAVLLLGPLYHLTDRSERMRAVREARRILKPGGILFAAAISRFASLIDGVATGAFSDPQFRDIVARDLETGEHRNPSDNPAYFTTAHFHRPEELSSEVGEIFQDVRLVAVEGPVWMAAHFRQIWEHADLRAKLLEHLEKVEAEPSILGTSAHILAIGKNLR